MEELAQKLVFWLREKVKEAEGEGVVVGMSGGVDSSVAAVLCQRAFPQKTLGVMMPCYSEELDEAHARLVADKFGINTVKVVLDGIFDTLLKQVRESELRISQNRRVEGNLKPRLRMIILYYLANALNYLVVGGSNRSELSVGYFTKYGDGGVDLMPLGNLVKQEVRQLAVYLGIPREIIDKPPSAGLWKGQTDEGELGLTYAELDFYLKTGRAKEEIKKRIDSMINKNRHKRLPPLLPPME